MRKEDHLSSYIQKTINVESGLKGFLCWNFSSSRDNLLDQLRKETIIGLIMTIGSDFPQAEVGYWGNIEM